MANSKYEYVKLMEQENMLPANNWIAISVTAHNHARFLEAHQIERSQSLGVGLECAKLVTAHVFDMVFAYGSGTEFSFIIHKSSSFFSRRESKLISIVVSSFTSFFVQTWSQLLPENRMILVPVFASDWACFPDLPALKKYLTSKHGSGCFSIIKQKLQEEGKQKTTIATAQGDISADEFWDSRPHLLREKESKRSIKRRTASSSHSRRVLWKI